MSIQSADRVIARPQGIRTPMVHKPSLLPRVMYDVAEDKVDDRMSSARGIMTAVLLSLPLWGLLAAAIYLFR